MSAETHRIPGQYVYDGIVFGSVNPAAALDKIKTITDYSGDLLLATYPKTGETSEQYMTDLVINDLETGQFILTADSASSTGAHLY